MLIKTTVEAIFSGSAQAVYDHINRCGTHLPDFMHRYGPIPGIVETKPLFGNWGTPGSKRLVYLDDGGTAVDHILEIDVPKFFSYEIVDLSFSLKYFVKRVLGKWQFQQQGRNTLVTWEYLLEPKSILFVPLLFLIASLFIKPYLSNTLSRMRRK